MQSQVVQVAETTMAPPMAEPAVQPSRSVPETDPLRDVQDVVDAIHVDSAALPLEYLEEIRVILGAE